MWTTCPYNDMKDTASNFDDMQYLHLNSGGRTSVVGPNNGSSSCLELFAIDLSLWSDKGEYIYTYIVEIFVYQSYCWLCKHCHMILC